MKPCYSYGYKIPSIPKFIFNLLALLILPYLLTLMINNIINSFSESQPLPLYFIYPVMFLLIFLIASISQTTGIYLFYNTFMLYKEKLSFLDRIRLFIMRNDLNQMETFLDKRNYINIQDLEIKIAREYYTRTNETRLKILFMLYFDDHKEYKFNIAEGTKKAYQSFLTPFLNYHVPITDSHDLIGGLNQPLRLTEYFKQKD